MSAHPRLSNSQNGQTGLQHKSTCKTLSKEQNQDPTLRTACDGCHTAKIRCTGGSPCARCARDNLKCHYSQKSKIGKPRGSLNKKTIERLRQMKEQQRLAPQTPPSTAGSMDVPKTIPPLPSCDEHSELSDDASLKVGDQVTRTPAQFSLGSPSFEDLIFSAEVSQMESWLPEMPGDCFQNGMNPPEILSKPETEHTNRASDPINMRSREDPQNASSISYKPLPLETFACPSPQSNESSPFGFTMPITTGSSLTTQSCISKSPCACFSTLSHHLCTLQATYSTTEHSQALDTFLIQSQQILPSIRSLSKCQTCLRDTQTLFLVNMILSRLLKWTHASICTCETRCISAEIRLGKFHGSTGMGIMVTRLLIRAYLAEFDKVVEVFGGTVSRVGFGEDGAYLGLQVRNFQMEVRGLMERIPKYC